MNKTIDNNTITAETTTTVTPANSGAVLEFASRPFTRVATALMLFRRAVDGIGALRGSLLGPKPRCADSIGLNLEYHHKMREINTMEEVKAYWEYLQKISQNTAGPHPLIGVDHEGYFYKTASGRALIQIRILSPEQYGERFLVIRGNAFFCNPNVPRQILRRSGFSIRTL